MHVRTRLAAAGSLPLVAALAASCATGVPDRASRAATAPAPHATPAFADAVAAGSQRHQPVIAEFGAPWCKPCRAFAEHVLTDPRVEAALRDVVFVQYDIETAIGKDAAARCHVTGIPAVVRVAPDGSVHSMTAGTEPTADELVAFVRTAVGPQAAPAP